jgi:Domain of unknown function (DUF6968)
MKKLPKIKLGQVIARRVLTEYTGDSIREVAISIGAPRPHPKGDWECPFAIESYGQSEVESARGVDALQAFLMATEGVRTRLDQTGYRYEWLGLGPDLGWGAGIPRQVPMGYGKRFEKRLNQVIESETARYWDSRLRIRKARIAEFESELNQRKKTVATWEAILKKRKLRASSWEADLKAQKKARTDKTLKKGLN